MREQQRQHGAPQCTRETEGDCYVGTAAQLVEEGIITLDQLPGMPGMPKVSASFVDGVMQPANSRPFHDPSWMRVVLYGNKVLVTCGISEEERDRRRHAALAEAEAKRKAAGVPDIGLPAAVRLFGEASAAFNVGDAVVVDGKTATVIDSHRVHSVASSTGQYVQRAGERVEYRPGYVCRASNGDEFFWPAHEVLTADGQRGHLRLVYARSVDVVVAPPAPKVEPAVIWPFATVHGSPV